MPNIDTNYKKKMIYHLIDITKLDVFPQAYCQLKLTYIEHNLIFYLQETLLVKSKIYTSLRQKNNQTRLPKQHSLLCDGPS